MADNITVNQGSGGATIRAENTAGNLFVPVTKIHNGADDVDGGSITATNPFAVQISQANAAITAANPLPVQTVPSTTGGDTIAKVLAAASTNATSVKGAAGQIYSWQFFNAAASARYVHFYNKATAPTVGTDVPVYTVGIGIGASCFFTDENGIAFSTGIAYAITTGSADTDAAAVSLGDVTGLITYK